MGDGRDEDWVYTQLARDSLRLERIATIIESLQRDAEEQGAEIRDLPTLRTDLGYIRNSLRRLADQVGGMERYIVEVRHEREMMEKLESQRKWWWEWMPAAVATLAAIVTMVFTIIRTG